MNRSNVPTEPQALIPYRGYLIRRNPINGLIWVEIDGFALFYPFSIDYARAQIDALLEESHA
jgi:hypothetical protein